MLTYKKTCPDCQHKLEVIALSELLGQTSEPDLNAAFKLVENIFDRFNFYVCPECGRTLVYAVPEVRQLAAESGDELIGIS